MAEDTTNNRHARFRRRSSFFEYGDLKRVSKVASVRKSVLAMLYGKYLAGGTIDLNATVEQLGLVDVQPFLPIEKRATLLHLLTARSGIYHPSGNESLTSLSPRRGAQIPGTSFQYQNWDFNAAGTAFEKLVRKDIFEALETDLARPIGMQDFDRSRQQKNSSMPDSVHPEYAMYLFDPRHGASRTSHAPRRRLEWGTAATQRVVQLHHDAGDPAA